MESVPKIEHWTEPPAMDTGSPRPELYFSHDLYCTYYLPDFVSVEKEQVAVLRFEGVLHFRMGHPNDEALHGHALYQRGLRQYDFFLVLDSPLIAEIEANNAVHIWHRPRIYSHFKHWIVTFHDETLEVVSRSASFLGTSESAPSDAIRTFLRSEK